MERNDLLFTQRVVHLYKIASRLSSRYYKHINITTKHWIIYFCPTI